MGTSDVVLVSTSTYNPHPEYHAFFHPAQNAPTSGKAGKLQYFNMLVYKSESLLNRSLQHKIEGVADGRRLAGATACPGPIL